MESRLRKNDAEALQELIEAFQTFHETTGRWLFFATELWDMAAGCYKMFRYGPEDVDRRYLEDLVTSSLQPVALT